MERARSSPGVAVHFGQDDAGEMDHLMKNLCQLDGLLSRHGVRDQEPFLRGDALARLAEFFHQGLVDLKAARRVHNDRVRPCRPARGQACIGDGDGVVAGCRLVDPNPELFAEDFELLNGGRTVNVGGDEKRAVSLPLAP